MTSHDKAGSRMKRKIYEKELRKLQVELCHLQEWVKEKKLRVIILFEGRDAAGKGGTIKAITEKVNRTFILRIRYPGSASPSRREIGQCADMTLADAREKARKWRSLVKQGVDPMLEEEKSQQEAIRKQTTTFAAVVKDFIR
jgi:hypothetical protein